MFNYDSVCLRHDMKIKKLNSIPKSSRLGGDTIISMPTASSQGSVTKMLVLGYLMYCLDIAENLAVTLLPRGSLGTMVLRSTSSE